MNEKCHSSQDHQFSFKYSRTILVIFAILPKLSDFVNSLGRNRLMCHLMKWVVADCHTTEHKMVVDGTDSLSGYFNPLTGMLLYWNSAECKHRSLAHRWPLYSQRSQKCPSDVFSHIFQKRAYFWNYLKKKYQSESNHQLFKIWQNLFKLSLSKKFIYLFLSNIFLKMHIIIFCSYNTFENNFQLKFKFKKYLKEIYASGSD